MGIKQKKNNVPIGPTQEPINHLLNRIRNEIQEPKVEASRVRDPLVVKKYQYADLMQKMSDFMEKKDRTLTNPDKRNDYIRKHLDKLMDFRKECTRLQVNKQHLEHFDNLIEKFTNSNFKKKLDSNISKLEKAMNLPPKEKKEFLKQNNQILGTLLVECILKGVDESKLQKLLEKIDSDVRKQSIRENRWEKFHKSTQGGPMATRAEALIIEHRQKTNFDDKGKDSVTEEESPRTPRNHRK